MTGSRLKLISLALVGALAAIVLLAWSQPWFVLRLADETITVSGDLAAAALPPLALASFALVLALALAGPVFRVVLALLEFLLGATVALVSGLAIADPVAASAPAITAATGVSGSGSIAELVEQVQSTAWPTVAFVAGVLMGATGIAVALTATRWPRGGRKYSRSRLEAAEGVSPVDEWDALSEGDDPTGPEAPSR
jgi:hypothetical protein